VVSTELEFPTEDIILNLPPTAAGLCLAAQELLKERGFHALTLEAITEKAGANKASVKYYFGNKDGLLAAVVDSLTPRQAIAEMVASTDPLPPGPERLHAHIEGLRAFADDIASYRAFFDTFPHVLQHPHLRSQVADLYAWHRQLNVRMFGVEVPKEEQRRLASVAALVTAAIDGVALQTLLDPDGFDLDGALSALEDLLAAYLSKQIDQAGAAST
jgi:TetR/AcrR family acrAB operon transcriptional repressor